MKESKGATVPLARLAVDFVSTFGATLTLPFQ
jgi:hypothetical protein